MEPQPKPAVPTDSPPRSRRPPLPFWMGCDVAAWARLLARHGFAIHRSRWRAALVVSGVSIINSVLGLAQRAIYGPRVAATPVDAAPIFILGHWRTGTTLLHELLGQDPRHAFPTTYECFAPHHFLLTRSWLPARLGRLAPSRKPLDNMAAGWERPQEDEFALCLLGQPSPYERIAFPNRLGAGAGTMDLRGLSPRALRRWKRTMLRFVQALTLAHPGHRLVFKSPPHTCRIPLLLELFPDARFLHIVRDPYAVYPSTLHMWRAICSVHSLQPIDWERLPEHVLGTFVRLYERLEEGKQLIPPGQFCELRYEDLLRDPVGQLEGVYRALALGDFEPARSALETHLAGIDRYETNRYLLTAEERRTITDRWGQVIQRYGYAVRES